MVDNTGFLLVVRNEAQKALFEQELSGQISDGAWENLPGNHWEQWSGVTVEVGENVGRNFYATKDNYNFTRKDLLDIVGDRMLRYAQDVAGIGYEWADMIDDLKDLKTIIKTVNKPTPEQQARIDARVNERNRKAAEAQAQNKALAEQINERAKELGISLYAGTYDSWVQVRKTDLLNLLNTALVVRGN